MSTTAAPNMNDTPGPNKHLQSPSSFSLLPNDLVLNILAGVPRRYHPILSCVSKNFRSLIGSSVLHETRSLMGKDSFYICLKERYAHRSSTHQWYTLTENRLVSVSLPSPPEPCSAALMVGPEIYFVGGNGNHLSSSMWILDSQSGKMRQGPSMRVARGYTAAGLVERKIYAFGRYEDEDKEIQAEVFDPKQQTWQVAPNPSLKMPFIYQSGISPSLDRKIYVRTYQHVIVYDPRDGKCENIRVGGLFRSSFDVCVIDNILYDCGSCHGLMWYDSNKKEWRVVKGLKPDDYSASYETMAEYNGKLLLFSLKYFWENKNKIEIWCAMISLDRSGVDVMGTVEWFDCLLSVPYNVEILHCLGRTD